MHGSMMRVVINPSDPAEKLKRRVYALKEAQGVLKVRRYTKTVKVTIGDASITAKVEHITTDETYTRVSKYVVKRRKVIR